MYKSFCAGRILDRQQYMADVRLCQSRNFPLRSTSGLWLSTVALGCAPASSDAENDAIFDQIRRYLRGKIGNLKKIFIACAAAT